MSTTPTHIHQSANRQYEITAYANQQMTSTKRDLFVKQTDKNLKDHGFTHTTFEHAI